MNYPAIFLDRDGVINPVVLKDGKPYPPMPKDYSLFPEAKIAINNLKNLNYKVFIFTNQPDVTKKIITQRELDIIHEKVLKELAIDEIKTCIHISEDNCNCRKPKAGMIFDLQRKWKVDLTKSYVIGDRWRDIEAGELAGCKTVLIGDGYNEKEIRPNYKAKNILEASNIIKQQLEKNL